MLSISCFSDPSLKCPAVVWITGDRRSLRILLLEEEFGLALILRYFKLELDPMETG